MTRWHMRWQARWLMLVGLAPQLLVAPPYPQTPAGRPTLSGLSQTEAELGTTSLVHCTTTAGLLAIEVHPRWAPSAAKRFLELAGAGFYADTPLWPCNAAGCNFGHDPHMDHSSTKHAVWPVIADDVPWDEQVGPPMIIGGDGWWWWRRWWCFCCCCCYCCCCCWGLKATF